MRLHSTLEKGSGRASYMGLVVRVGGSNIYKGLKTLDSVLGYARKQLSSIFDPNNNMGALIVRIGSWGPLYYSYYSYNKEPPK